MRRILFGFSFLCSDSFGCKIFEGFRHASTLNTCSFECRHLWILHLTSGFWAAYFSCCFILAIVFGFYFHLNPVFHRLGYILLFLLIFIARCFPLDKNDVPSRFSQRGCKMDKTPSQFRLIKCSVFKFKTEDNVMLCLIDFWAVINYFVSFLFPIYFFESIGK